MICFYNIWYFIGPNYANDKNPTAFPTTFIVASNLWSFSYYFNTCLFCKMCLQKKLSFYIFCLKECEWIDQQLEIWIALKDRVKREKDMGEVFFLVWVNKKIPDLFLLVRKTISPCSTSISVLVSQSSTTTTTMFLFVLIRIFSFWKSIRK